jgi:hypothetical protein
MVKENWYSIIATSLPNPVIIPKPGKVAGMTWLVKHFQTLLISVLTAVIRSPDILSAHPQEVIIFPRLPDDLFRL